MRRDLSARNRDGGRHRIPKESPCKASFWGLCWFSSTINVHSLAPSIARPRTTALTAQTSSQRFYRQGTYMESATTGLWDTELELTKAATTGRRISTPTRLVRPQLISRLLGRKERRHIPVVNGNNADPVCPHAEMNPIELATRLSRTNSVSFLGILRLERNETYCFGNLREATFKRMG